MKMKSLLSFASLPRTLRAALAFSLCALAAFYASGAFAREAWMGEGFVSYYTELMRTRMGHRSEADGWRELAAAFERGRRGGRGLTLAATSARMMDMFAFQRVYWGGAAIAFEIDVTMRLDSDGRLGLDDAMRELRRCCGDAPRRWPAMTLLGKLDAWYGKPIFTTIAKKHLDRIVFPDTGERTPGV